MTKETEIAILEYLFNHVRYRIYKSDWNSDSCWLAVFKEQFEKELTLLKKEQNEPG